MNQKMAAPPCGACGAVFVCSNCGRTLRKQFAEMHEVDHLMMTAGGNSGGHHRFFDETKATAIYATSFPIGPRGGALIPFGNAITLECWLPYEEPGGVILPFVPMPFTGREIVHDIGRKKAVAPGEIESCQQGFCRCQSRPTGWQLTKPVVRAMLNVTDSWMHEHGRQLPGLIGGSWALVYDTRTFMKEVYFSPDFVLPKREESREARAQRTQSRSAGWKHTHPEHTRRRRR